MIFMEVNFYLQSCIKLFSVIEVEVKKRKYMRKYEHIHVYKNKQENSARHKLRLGIN